MSPTAGSPRTGDAAAANATTERRDATKARASGAAAPDPPWDSSAAALGWPTLLTHLAERCSTPRGQARALRLAPLADAAAVTETIGLVSEATALADANQALSFGPIAELAPTLLRLAKEGALSGPALYEVALTLQSLAEVRDALTRRRADASLVAPGLAARAAALHPLEQVWRPILDCCEPSGALADHASPELSRLRRRGRELQQQIVQQLKRLIETPRLARQLQERLFTEREGRYVLPFRADAERPFDGLVLGSSASGATVFVEPSAVRGLSNELSLVQGAVAREAARILLALSARVNAERLSIAADLELASELDLIAARARLAQRLGARPAAVAADAQIVLIGLRHPLLVLAGGAVVAHDLTLLPQQALLISGPNAGGKSVCLQAVGLCALMLRCGMHLPVAAESRLPLYHQIWADIGDEQSLERSLSSFTGHLARLLAFLARADRGTLLLIDEITTATDPGEGAALGQALLEALVQRVGQLIVTTHYERLKTLALADPRFINASVGFELQQLRPTFELHRGLPGSSFALAVAQRLGLPAALIGRARELLGEQGARTTELLAALADEQTGLRRARDQHRAAEQEAAAARQSYERLRAALGQREAQALALAHRDALAELRRARAELKALRSGLRKASDREQISVLDRQLSALARTVATHEPRPPAPPSTPLTGDALVAGAQVHLPSARRRRSSGPHSAVASPCSSGASARRCPSSSCARCWPPPRPRPGEQRSGRASQRWPRRWRRRGGATTTPSTYAACASTTRCGRRSTSSTAPCSRAAT
ncbi:MAG: endonuclease MutS2 [Proteobacteria bacterium]|nr:endonuclease MutS2 [Pseudomonadota bacterium]